jgi:hypothetical protein
VETNINNTANDMDLVRNLGNQRRTVVGTRNVRGMNTLLDIVAQIAVSQRAFPIRFAGGTRSFSTNITTREDSWELYVQTNPTKYTKQVEFLEGNDKDDEPNVAGSQAQKARTMRRLLKGYGIDSARVVRHEHLERMALIWGVAETARNPGSIAHLLTLLHLIKKGSVSWSEAVDENHANRYIPAGSEVSRPIQQLHGAMLDRIRSNTPIPKHLYDFAQPYRRNLKQFLMSAEPRILQSADNQWEICVRASNEAAAWKIIKDVLERKIIRHIRTNSNDL